MTTAVSKKRRSLRSGQSMIEFALLMPILVALFFALVQMENILSTAIVNNKYSRAMMFSLLFNNRYYPAEEDLAIIANGPSINSYGGYFYVGVDDKLNFGTNVVPHPRAPERPLGSLPGSEEPKEELPSQGRQNLRIRVFGSICLPPMGIKKDQSFSEKLGEGTFTGSSFNYCLP